MDYIQDACKLLVKTEEGLRGLIERGLSEQRYADVARLASLADELAALARRAGSSDGHMNRREDHGALHRSSVGRPTRKTRQRTRAEPRAKYPRFEREGDRLIKVGWSKKNGEVYEHRAPKAAVVQFGKHLADRVSPGTVFTMEELLPVPNGNGGDVPSYQAYLALAWLRGVGAVRRKGRDGYAFSEGAIDEATVESLWTQITERD